jgi:hypothetical protein
MEVKRDKGMPCTLSSLSSILGLREIAMTKGKVLLWGFYHLGRHNLDVC